MEERALVNDAGTIGLHRYPPQKKPQPKSHMLYNN